MHYRFNPRIFVDQPMHLTRTANDDYRVMIAGHTAGRIFKTMRGSNQYTWLWTVTGPHLPRSGLNSNGDCDSIYEAKSTFRSVFDTRLHWAVRQNSDVIWHE